MIIYHFSKGKKSYRSTAFSVIVLLYICCVQIWAHPTTQYEAEMVVKGWLKADPQPLYTKIGQQVERVETFTDAGGDPVYYIVYLNPSGFVIVSADDLVEPIIGFTAEGTYDPSPDNPLGALVTNDLICRITKVRCNISLQALGEAGEISLTDTQKKWHRFVNSGESSYCTVRLMGMTSLCDVRVAPLLQTKWGQGNLCLEKDGQLLCCNCFNFYTPNHYSCGCGVTAMAQLMRYNHEHTGLEIEIGRLEFTIRVEDVNHIVYTRGGDGEAGPYDWENMVPCPNYNTPVLQRSAIGALCYDLGIASDANYTSSGTGTKIDDITRALRNTFMYENAVIGCNLNSNIEIEDLNDMINPNLDANHPVILGLHPGETAGGKESHVVVCDGYGNNASTLYHHLNMGWYGYCDAWYNLLNIDSNPSFNVITRCIYNIFSSGEGEIISGRVTDKYGNPISQAIVTAKCGDSQYESTTNFNGIYALAKIPSKSTYTISVTKPGFIVSDQNSVITGISSDWENASGNKWQVDFVGCKSWIGISKSIEHYRDQEYGYSSIDAAIEGDDTVIIAASVLDPNGTTHPLNYEGEGEFCTRMLFDTAAQLAAFPSGDWVFTIYYTNGGSDKTIVHYPDIPLVTQEPKLIYPRPNDTNVPTLVTFTWEQVTDQNATSIELIWEPIDGCGLRGEASISLPKEEMQYGPVILSPNTRYELYLVFGRNYSGENSDGIHYVVDADSEQKYWFRTLAE